MKIVRQLADWLLQNDRITPERYGHVMDAILGGADTTAGFLIEAAVDRRDRREAARLKAQGVKPGVPDLFLPFFPSRAVG